MDHIPALILLPPGGDTPPERFLAQGRLAAALGLVDRLQEAGGYGPLYCVAERAEDQEQLALSGAEAAPVETGDFHFGRVLVDFIERLEPKQLAYFGGASAPLLGANALSQVRSQLNRGEGPRSVVNNVHSTDWALIAHAAELAKSPDRLPSDNPLGWVMRNELGFRVAELPPSASTRMDIDTPADIFLCAIHPGVGEGLKELAFSTSSAWLDRLRAVREILNTPASILTVIGRSSSHAWQELERQTQIWVRMLVEERGMTASGRLARGEVRSLIAALLDRAGPQEFVRLLEESCSAVMWDTRVWMAACGLWPPPADRFAADLGWVDQIKSAQLRELADAIEAARIPILTGGHGLVSGGVYALLESLSADSKIKPEA